VPKPKIVFLYPLLCLYGVTISTASFACLAAIPLMPIGDLIVICFTSPVFSVFLDRLVLKRPLTILSICLCLFIIIGDVLVVQPPLIFTRDDDDIDNNTIKAVIVSEEDTSNKKHEQNYFLGVALCMYTAAAVSIANVIGAQCNKMAVSTNYLMLVSGYSSLLLSLISSLFLTNRLLSAPLSLPIEAAVLLPLSAAITMIAYWTITLAVSITRHPTLISMLRSTEILISLVTESLWWNQLPGTVSLLGSLLVAACVFSMAAQDWIAAAARQAGGSCKGKKGTVGELGEANSVVTKL
jgi:drug/metabolite transporter (DMT)-like permease